MLYMGYVGFSVAFAFACAAMLEGRLDQTWAKWTPALDDFRLRMFQTIGIALGSWWAYYELGWGGWWFWDPLVENASFMPWLVGTALIHSLSVTEKRGISQELDSAARHLCLLIELGGDIPGALRRAGVGAFIRDRSDSRSLHPGVPGKLTIGGSLTLYAWRAPKLYAPGVVLNCTRASSSCWSTT